MAEIKIKEKKPIWPWILLALVILALLFFLLQDDDDVTDDYDSDDIEMIDDNDMDDDDMDDDTMDNNTTARLSDSADSKIAEYNTYVSENMDMDINHEYSNAVLSRLINATEALANSLDVDINADLEEARAQTASITKDPYDTDHANKIKQAGNTIVRGLKKIQTQKFPSMTKECTELQNAIMDINTQTLTLNQKQDVKAFFKQAGELLTNMKNA